MISLIEAKVPFWSTFLTLFAKIEALTVNFAAATKIGILGGFFAFEEIKSTATCSMPNAGTAATTAKTPRYTSTPHLENWLPAFGSGMEQIVNSVRRADSAALLCESLQIVMKRIEKFEIEFESEINPERSVGRCWKYAQDVIHDFHTAMVTSFYRTDWCEEGQAIIKEIRQIFLAFISEISHALGTDSGPIFLDGFDELAVQPTMDVLPQLKLQNSAKRARVLRQSLDVIVSRVRQLTLRYEDDLENNKRGFQP